MPKTSIFEIRLTLHYEKFRGVRRSDLRYGWCID